jgi:hypothetical protein
MLKPGIDYVPPHAGGTGLLIARGRRLVENHQTCSKITTGGYFASIAKQDCDAHANENTAVRMTRSS